VVRVRSFAHDHQNGVVGNDEIIPALECDVDAGLAEEEHIIPDAGLHGHVTRLTSLAFPGFRVGFIEGSDRDSGTERHDPAALHGARINGGLRQIQSDASAFLADLRFDEDAVADDDELFLQGNLHESMFATL